MQKKSGTRALHIIKNWLLQVFNKTLKIETPVQGRRVRKIYSNHGKNAKNGVKLKYIIHVHWSYVKKYTNCIR